VKVNEEKWVMDRLFLFKQNVQISLKANGIIQYKVDKVIAFVYCKMRKALANVALVYWNGEV